MDTLMHLTCTNMEKGMVNEALKVCVLSVFFLTRHRSVSFQAAKEQGIENILALRGGDYFGRVIRTQRKL